MSSEPANITEIEFPDVSEAIRRIGPAFILGALTIGPGALVVSSVTGAQFGYGLLWILMGAVLFSMIFLDMSSRIGILSDKSFWGLVEERFGRTAAVAGAIMGVLTTIGYETGNIVGVALGLKAILGGDIVLWGTVAAASALFLISRQDLYSKLERVILILIGVMIVGFVGTLYLAGFSPTKAATGLIPSFENQRALFLGMALLSTSFSMSSMVCQTYLTKEKGYAKSELGQAIFDSLAAMIIMGVILSSVLITSAAVLNPAGIVPETAADIALQLQPIAGENAKLLFGVALLAAAFSSIVVNAMRGGTYFADGIAQVSGMDDRIVKLASCGVIVIAWATAIIPQLFGGSAIDTIIIAQEPV
jgi:manganese transport protein